MRPVSLVALLLSLALAATASSAELPNRKAGADQPAKVCNIGGAPGLLVPGSETCVKISGGVSVETIVAPLHPGYQVQVK